MRTSRLGMGSALVGGWCCLTAPCLQVTSRCWNNPHCQITPTVEWGAWTSTSGCSPVGHCRNPLHAAHTRSNPRRGTGQTAFNDVFADFGGRLLQHYHHVVIQPRCCFFLSCLGWTVDAAAVTMLTFSRGRRGLLRLSALLCCVLFASRATASVGDRLPDFKECVRICERENCGPDAEHHTPIRMSSLSLYGNNCKATMSDPPPMQPSSAASSSGPAQPNATIPANTSSHTDASPPRPRSRSCSSTANGPSRAC